jgi:hypothetical protein
MDAPNQDANMHVAGHVTPVRTLVFRNAVTGSPEPHEICVMWADRQSPTTWPRAVHVLTHGLADLPRGTGKIERIVVPLDPTFDDMLAATFCSWLLADQALPPGAAALAEYAKLARAGLRPSPQPLEASIEGVFMAIRNISGEDLSQSTIAARFASDWWRMADRLMQAARDSRNPLTERLFDDIHFARERSYLEADHKVFLQDVAGGEIWKVELPGCATAGRALLLRNPKSLLFKYFARSDADAPGGRAFDLLAVQWGPGKWVFSTDPVRRIPLRQLHAVLQKAEVAHDPTRSTAEAWFDGEPFQHTLISTPANRSVLPDAEILQIVRKWARARPEPNRGQRRRQLLGAGLAVICVVGAVSPWLMKEPASIQPFVAEREVRGLDYLMVDDPQTPATRHGVDHALLIAIEDYRHPPWQHLGTPVADVKAISDVLRTRFGFHTSIVTDPTAEELRHAIEKLASLSYQPDDQLLVFIAGHGHFRNDTRQAFVVGKDATKDRGLVSLSDVSDVVNKLRCEHVLLILDICHGGAIDIDIALGGKDYRIAKLRGKSEEVSKEEFIREKLEPRTRRYLTSVGNEPASDGEEHSPFAAKLLDALEQGSGDDGILTLGELKTYIEKLKPRPHDGQLTLNQSESDFLFIQLPKP